MEKRSRLVALSVVVATVLVAPSESRAGDAAAVDSIAIRYLGTSGLSLRHGNDHLLTAPFFSNPGIWRVTFGRIESDESRFPEALDEIVAGAAAMLVGHAHYDHLLDVPGIARRMLPSAIVYGSETAAHILAAAPDFPLRVVTLDSRAGDSEHPGEWIDIDGTAIRFMALRSGHAPHYAGLRVYDGVYTEDLQKLPERAKGWKLGLPLSFVIDFLNPDSRAPVYRIYFQEAATEDPQGFPPPLGDGKAYDLAVLCVASFGQVANHPEAILQAVRPRAVLLTHWEDFFTPQSKPVRPVRGTNVERFMQRFEAARPRDVPYWMPNPGDTITIPLRGS